MNKLRVIDLLNKIANGEEVPKKIKYLTSIYTLRSNNNYYVENSDSSHSSGLYYQMIGGSRLNDEVEVIEEDSKIQRIGANNYEWNYKYPKDTPQAVVDNLELVRQKINEIIDYINKEK